MKIYQLHKYGGEWEDAYDHIIGSYLYKERAEQAMVKAQKEELENRLFAKQCLDCPVFADISDNKTLANLMHKYCDHSDIDCDDEGELFCKNFYSHWPDNNFDIEEVEVAE